MANLGTVLCSGHRLPSQAKYVIMSVRKFFEKERSRSLYCVTKVKQTSVACGVGTATVVRICKEYEGNSGLLSSPIYCFKSANCVG